MLSREQWKMDSKWLITAPSCPEPIFFPVLWQLWSRMQIHYSTTFFLKSLDIKFIFLSSIWRYIRIRVKKNNLKNYKTFITSCIFPVRLMLFRFILWLFDVSCEIIYLLSKQCGKRSLNLCVCIAKFFEIYFK